MYNRRFGRKKQLISLVLTGALFAGCFTGCGLFPFAEGLFEEDSRDPVKIEFDSQEEGEPPAEDAQKEDISREASSKEGEDSREEEGGVPAPSIQEQADRLAAMYDYDKAMELLKGAPDYDSNAAYQEAVAGYEAEKAACVEYPLEQITHVFYHTLIKDPALAFDGDSREAGYNQVMTTIDEFNRITQSMYEKGYVMVSLHDMASVNEDGTMSRGSILLPPGKIPFVLSQDDVSYYHYMEGDGMASRLILNEDGEVKNEYVEKDGSVSVGDFDLVPLIDTFVDEHPDFSYRGAKGLLAMTGYNGVLGYRTDIAYQTGERLDEFQQAWLDAHPDFDFETEAANAKKVAEAMKADGWEFASHTWGHLNATEESVETLRADNEKWENYVAPILGDTDIVVFAFGADIGDWQNYTYDNPKFAYFKERGYNYYCNVDSSQYWVQMTDQYLRQGRRNLDGYRMYYQPELLSDLFDVEEVWDDSRPTPVPPM